MEAFEYFVSYLIAPVIFAVGLVGNLLGIILFWKKKLNQIGPRLIFISLFVTDTCMIALIWQPYLSFGFNKDLTLVSESACRIYWYLDYIIAPISPVLLCYISIERVASVVYSNKILKNIFIQIIALVIIVLFNSFYYIEVAYWFQIGSVASNITTNTTDSNVLMSCNFKDLNTQNIISYMDLINRVLIPFPFMMLTTIWLIYKIVNSRSRIILNYASKQGRAFNRQIKFSITVVSLNIIYLLLSLPLSVEVFLSEYNSDAYLIIYLALTYLFYAGYAINFYIILASNKLARRQCCIFLKILPQTEMSVHKASTQVNYS